MAIRKLEPELAQFILDNSNNEYIDAVHFGDGDDDGPWLAVTSVGETYVLYYSDSVEHSEAWQGTPEEIIEKGEEMVESELESYRRLDLDVTGTTYDESLDPVFDISDEYFSEVDA